jgi:hypothetical protein
MHSDVHVWFGGGFSTTNALSFLNIYHKENLMVSFLIMIKSIQSYVLISYPTFCRRCLVIFICNYLLVGRELTKHLLLIINNYVRRL